MYIFELVLTVQGAHHLAGGFGMSKEYVLGRYPKLEAAKQDLRLYLDNDNNSGAFKSAVRSFSQLPYYENEKKSSGWHRLVLQIRELHAY